MSDTESAEKPSAPVEQAQEVETAAPSEPAEAKEGETQPKDGEDKAEEQKEDQPKEPSLKGASKKIGKLTRKLTQSQSEIEYLRAQLEKVLSPKQAEPSREPVNQAKAEGKPNPNDFEDHASYVEALTDWKIEQRDKAREQKSKEESAKTEFQKQQETFHEKARAFAKEHPDYQETLDEVNHVRLSLSVQQSILKHGPELAYELAKDPEELERICALPALDAAEAIGEIRARMRAAKQDPKPQPKLTNAPKPPTPIASKTAPVRRSVYDENLPFADYVQLRREAMRKRG